MSTIDKFMNDPEKKFCFGLLLPECDSCERRKMWDALSIEQKILLEGNLLIRVETCDRTTETYLVKI